MSIISIYLFPLSSDEASQTVVPTPDPHVYTYISTRSTEPPTHKCASCTSCDFSPIHLLRRRVGGRSDRAANLPHYPVLGSTRIRHILVSIYLSAAAHM